MNRTDIIGNLTADPETRTVNTEKGTSTVCNFTVAVNRAFRDRKFTDYFRVSTWGTQADICMKYLLKGKKVRVTGIVSVNAYIGNDGKPHGSLELSASEIEFLSPNPNSEQTFKQSTDAADQFSDISPDEVPF